MHLVWCTKYRKRVLVRDIGERLRDLVRQICSDMKAETGNVTDQAVKEYIEGHTDKDDDFKVADFESG